MTAVLTPTQSLVVDFVLMAATGNGLSDHTEYINSDCLRKAADYMLQRAEDDNPISEFEDIYPILQKEGYGAENVFNCDVTEETIEAYVAYLCYAI